MNVVMQNPKSGVETVEVVTQKMLRAYVSAKKRLDGLHKTILASLKVGASVDAGKRGADLDVGSEKRPKWRQAFVNIAGEAAAKALVDSTSRTPYCRLRVS